MNTRFYNARILLPDGKRDFLIGEGELWVENSIITCVGTPEGTPPVWDREIDCGGNLLMPGFKNMHTHSAMTFLRSYADNYELFKQAGTDNHFSGAVRFLAGVKTKTPVTSVEDYISKVRNGETEIFTEECE